MDKTDLADLKYTDLQKLAKEHGIKANMKCDKLRKALQSFFEDSSFSCEEANVKKNNKPMNQDLASEAVVIKNNGKRKQSQIEAKSPDERNKRPRKKSILDVPKKDNITSTHNGKRKRTYDKVGSDEEASNSAKKNIDEQSRSPHSRSKTKSCNDNVAKNKDENESPGVKEMINGMKDNMTDTQMKESLLKALDKRVKQKHNDSDRSSNLSQIPVYSKKAVTPGNKDWEGIHQKQFKKMESIDVYLERKRQRTESLTTSMKKMRMLSQQMRNVVESVKKYQTPPSILKKSVPVGPAKSKASLFQSPGIKPFVPTVTSTKNATFNFSKHKSPAPKPFVPTVTSTSKANFNFSSRRSPRLSGGRSINNSSKENIQRNQANTSILNKTGNTPFRFTGSLNKSSILNKSQNTSINAKPKFDLKASLAKPITWKTHKGALKPMKSEYIFAQAHTLKSKSKEECRKAVQTKRTNKKNDIMMKRRGVNVK